MRPIVKGFPATSQDDYQLNVTNILRQAAGSFGNQEIVSRRHDGSMLRCTYKEAYGRIQRLANALEGLGVDMIYTFGMGMRAMQLCSQMGIGIKTGRFETVEDVIKNLDCLEDLDESCGH